MGIDLTPSSQAEEELEIFLREHQNEFYRLAYSYVKNADEALDVVQEAAIKAFVHRSSLRNPQNIKAWFYRILVNESLTWLRRNRRMYTVPSDYLEGMQSEERTERFDENLDLYKAVLQLDPKLRTVVLLRFFEGMKLEDIAVVTNARLSTVKTRLYRALKELKTMLGEEISA